MKPVTEATTEAINKTATMTTTKGQLILKGLFKVYICNKKQTKIFLYFCPSFKKPLKSGRNKR